LLFVLYFERQEVYLLRCRLDFLGDALIVVLKVGWLYEDFSWLQAWAQIFYVFLEVFHLLKLELELLSLKLDELTCLIVFLRSVVVLNRYFNRAFDDKIEEVALRTELKDLFALSKLEVTHARQDIIQGFVSNSSCLEERMLAQNTDQVVQLGLVTIQFRLSEYIFKQLFMFMHSIYLPCRSSCSGLTLIVTKANRLPLKFSTFILSLKWSCGSYLAPLRFVQLAQYFRWEFLSVANLSWDFCWKADHQVKRPL